MEDITPLRLTMYLIVVLLSTAILTPLEVIGTRLAIQGKHAFATCDSVAQEKKDKDEKYAGAEEDVVRWVTYSTTSILH